MFNLNIEFKIVVLRFIMETCRCGFLRDDCKSLIGKFKHRTCKALVINEEETQGEKNGNEGLR